MLAPLAFLDLVSVSVEVVFELDLLHQLGTSRTALVNIEDVFGAGDPLVEALLHHDSVQHVPYPGELVVLPVARSDSNSLLLLFLAGDGVFKVLLVILKILSLLCELHHFELVSLLLPFEEGFGKILFVEIDQAELDSGHVVSIELAVLTPYLKSSIHDILVPFDAVSEHLSLVFLVAQFDKLIFLALQLLPLWNLILKLLSSSLKLIIDIAVANGIKDSLQQHFCSCSFYLLDQELLLGEVLFVPAVFTPALPGLEFDDLVLCLLVHDGQLEGQEDLLLEPHGSHKVAHVFVSLLKGLPLRVSQPLDEGLSSVQLLLSLHHLEDIFLLAFLPERMISPLADVLPELPLLIRECHPSQHSEPIDLETVRSLTLQVGSAPVVEELGLHLLVDVVPDKVLILIVFMHEVHRVSVPSPQKVAFSLGCVVAHDSHKLVDILLDIFHFFGAVFDLLDG